MIRSPIRGLLVAGALAVLAGAGGRTDADTIGRWRKCTARMPIEKMTALASHVIVRCLELPSTPDTLHNREAATMQSKEGTELLYTKTPTMALFTSLGAVSVKL